MFSSREFMKNYKINYIHKIRYRINIKIKINFLSYYPPLQMQYK